MEAGEEEEPVLLGDRHNISNNVSHVTRRSDPDQAYDFSPYVNTPTTVRGRGQA